MKPSSEEDFLRKKAPVDRPLEKEDSAEVESANDIVERMGGKEGQGEYHLKFSRLKLCEILKHFLLLADFSGKIFTCTPAQMLN